MPGRVHHVTELPITPILVVQSWTPFVLTEYARLPATDDFFCSPMCNGPTRAHYGIPPPPAWKSNTRETTSSLLRTIATPTISRVVNRTRAPTHPPTQHVSMNDQSHSRTRKTSKLLVAQVFNFISVHVETFIFEGVFRLGLLSSRQMMDTSRAPSRKFALRLI